MKRFARATLGSAAFALALAGAAAFAQVGAAALPAEQFAGGVSYVSGGVSEEQAAAFKQARSGYPLSIELLQKSADRNQFTADAQVIVSDSAGNVLLNAKSDGPYMLVRVPPGQYRVQATLNGRTVEAKPVTVGAQGGVQATVVFPPKTD
jgi:hypothetical protein